MAGTTDFSYAHDGVSLTGQIAWPTGERPHPAVLVMHSDRLSWAQATTFLDATLRVGDS